MDVVDALVRLGGVADARTLLQHTSRQRVATAVRNGLVVREARGRYALPAAEAARRAASRLSGVVGGLSAAAAHGWELKVPPARPCVIVPAKRKVPVQRRRGVEIRWRDLDPDDVWNGVLRPGPTVIDCAKSRPFDEALSVADSAVRHGQLTEQRLDVLARQVPTTGRTACLRVAREASGLAANPFESVLRAIALEVPTLDLRPQVVIAEDGWSGRPDLVDPLRRLVLEADSYAFHGGRTALVRDCERYNALTLRGWTVLRFSWEHVMLDPDYVGSALRRFAERHHAVEQETLALGRRRRA